MIKNKPCPYCREVSTLPGVDYINCGMNDQIEKGERMPYKSKVDWKFIAFMGMLFIIGGIIAGK